MYNKEQDQTSSSNIEENNNKAKQYKNINNSEEEDQYLPVIGANKYLSEASQHFSCQSESRKKRGRFQKDNS